MDLKIWRMLFIALVLLSAPLTMLWTAVEMVDFPGHIFLLALCIAGTAAYIAALGWNAREVWRDGRHR